MKKFLTLLAVVTAIFLQGGENVRVVTSANFPPYEFYEGGKIVGIDIDIMREVFHRNNMMIVVEDMKFDSLIVAIQTGKGDVAASGITVTEDRKQKIDFSIPYVVSAQMVIVKQDSPVASPENLTGLRIGVQSGTTGDTYVTENLHEPHRYDDASTAVAALISGKLDAVVLDSEPAQVHVAKNSGLKLLAEPLTREEYAFAVAKGNAGLLEMINRSVREMIADGTIESIRRKYEEKNQQQVIEAQEQKQAGSFQNELYTTFIKDQRWRYLYDG